MSYLLDTCVVTECLKPDPEPGVLDWLDSNDSPGLYLSVLVVGEIRQGIARVAGTEKAREIEAWLVQRLLPRFDHRILPVDDAVAAKWGVLRGTAMAEGRTLPVIDSLLAATAIEHRLTVVTRNTRDFKPTGANIFSPWPSER